MNSEALRSLRVLLEFGGVFGYTSPGHKVIGETEVPDGNRTQYKVSGLATAKQAPIAWIVRASVPLWLAAFMITTFLGVNSASAHHRRASLNPAGIEIANLTHGQLRVMADFRTAIVDLAAKQVHTDDVLRRLLNFTNIQFAYCFWGLIPGALSDEASPFNECTHAYLAGSKALLMHLQNVAEDRDAANRLAMQINEAMMYERSSLQLCQNSLGTFNTAEIVYPDWAAQGLTPISAMVLSGLALGFAAGLGCRRRAALPTGQRR